MRTLRLGRFGRARVWLSDCPDATYVAAGEVDRIVPSGQGAARFSAIGIEALLPRGAFSEYGLLGLSVTQQNGSDLRLQVPWTQADGAAWANAPVGAIASPTVGLPHEFARAVVEGLDAAGRARVAGGVLTVRAAVHSPVGSNPNVMTRLARACVGLMLRGDMEDAELSAFLESVLLD